MLVTMLIYIYPLKAIFSSMWFSLSGGRVGHVLGAHSESQVRALRGFCFGIHRYCTGDGVLEFPGVAVAGAVAIGRTGTSNDVSGDNRMEYSSRRRTCFAGVGAMPPSSPNRVERLDLFLHGHSRATAQGLL